MSNDRREFCITSLPSGCVPYTGELLEKYGVLCKPNINDVFKLIQTDVENLFNYFGDRTKLNTYCHSSDLKTLNQTELNSYVLSKLCTSNESNSEEKEIEIDLKCLENEGCTPKTSYTEKEIFEKIVNAYCNLLDRVKIIEEALNI